MATPNSNKVLRVDTLPKRVVDVEYSVRGPIVTRSLEIENELKKHPGSHPFTMIIPANIGNPHAVGQLPLTFHRQVMSCCLNPESLKDPNLPKDVHDRVTRYLSYQGMGAYSHSKGVLGFRKEVAKWMERRDGFPTDPENIFLTNGASSAVGIIVESLIATPTDGVMIPIPQYPLYTATLTRLGGTAVGYFLHEDKGWCTCVNELGDNIKEARGKGINVKAFVVINPGNPTGNVLRRDKMEELVVFCERERLVLLADEVYQDNVYGDTEFTPFRKVVLELKSSVELISFHSASKGYYGECGLRGGMMHLENIDSDVTAQLYKLSSTLLCANTLGQAIMASLVNPPQTGEPSYELFNKERQDILGALKRKADLVCSRLNQMDGISCQTVTGAMYAFPSLSLPPANGPGEADADYCMKLLEETGLVTVPGSGFGQRPGTNHLRITILPKEECLRKILDALEAFNKKYMSEMNK